MKSFVARMSLLAVCMVAAGMVIAPAHAGTECVDYTLTAPIIGTRSGSPCVTLPSRFDFPLAIHDCESFPPLGVSECLGARLHLYLP